MESRAATTPDKEVAKQLAEEEKAINLAMKRLKLLHIKARCIISASCLSETNRAPECRSVCYGTPSPRCWSLWCRNTHRVRSPPLSSHVTRSVLKPAPADVMYAAFMKSVNDAQAKIKEFTDLMKDETSTEVFTRASKSKEDNPLGIVPWRHGDYPGWFDQDKPWTA